MQSPAPNARQQARGTLGLRTALLGIALALWSPAGPRAYAEEPARASEPLPRHTPSRAYWSEVALRPFVGAVVDAGSSIRARLLVGYGRPHWTWGGLELEGASTSDTAIGAVRARLALVVADVGVAYRFTRPYRRTWVTREPGYTDGDLKGDPKASYRSLDIDVWGLIPAGSGFVQWELETVRLYGTRRGHDLYEEWLRAPVRPPWTTDARLAYAYTFFHDRAAVGAMAEWLWLGGRGHAYRVGPLLSYTLTPHWEANLLLTTPVHSPDDLGFFTGLYGTIRVRWRFASGEQRSVLR